LLKEVGIWVELTTLVIPSLNDSPEELSAIAAWIAGLDKDIPWHISRFHPDYKFNNYRVTPEKTLRQAVAAGEKAGLRFVYAGNVSGWGEDTLCPRCHKTLVRRQALAVLENNIRQGRCLYCQAEIPGVWMKVA
jgi:pyruvate formate lyase activating enzyme